MFFRVTQFCLPHIFGSIFRTCLLRTAYYIILSGRSPQYADSIYVYFVVAIVVDNDNICYVRDKEPDVDQNQAES